MQKNRKIIHNINFATIHNSLQDYAKGSKEIDNKSTMDKLIREIKYGQNQRRKLFQTCPRSTPLVI